MNIDYIEKKLEVQESEIEFEDNGIDTSFDGPFDPNEIDVDIATVNLGSLLEQLEYNEIDLTPEFQRSSDVWSLVKKSRLIESVLLGLPLPSFYFSEDPTSNKLIIVDGLQRLCAFKDFCIDKKMKLKGLQFLLNLEGVSFNDLDRSQIRRIKSLKVTLNTLRKNTPVIVKFVIFQRVNSAGVPLNAQEMRNALCQGRATDLLKRMAGSESFIIATGNRVKPRRMTDCDFTNRFLAFYLQVYDYDGKLDAFMSKTLQVVNGMEQDEISKIKKTFEKSMNVCHKLLEDTAFRRPDPDKPDEYLKINKAIFEVLSVSIAKLTDEDQEVLLNNKNLFKEQLHTLFKNEQFIKSVTSGTAKVPQVDYRFKHVNEVIKQVLDNDK